MALVTAAFWAGADARAATPAPRADAPRHFSIAAKPVSDALIDVGLQANLTIGGSQSCAGRSQPLDGTYSLSQALDRLLAGTACGYQLVRDGGGRVVAVRITPRRSLVAAVLKPRPRPRPQPLPVLDAPPPPSRFAPSEVVVTASRRATRVGDLPGGVSAVRGDQLVNTDVTDTGGVAQLVAGMITTNLGAARDKILLRGLSDGAFTGRTQSTVGTYLDDVPVTYNAPDPDLNLVDVDRVEILRGPQGALFGGGSLSGVYRIVTNKPVMNTYSGAMRTLVATTDGGSLSWKAQGMLNLPLVTDRVALRLVGYHDVDGGYIDDVNLRLSNVDRTTRDGGRAALAVDLGGSWTLAVSGAAQNLESTDTQYTSPQLGHLNRANQVREAHANHFLEAAIHLEGSGSWYRFESTTGYVVHRFNSRYDATAALKAFSEDARGIGLYDERTDVHRLAQDITLSSPSTQRLRWLVGVFASTSGELGRSDLRALTSTNPALQLYRERRHDKLNEVAAYGDLSLDLGWGWTASVGARTFKTRVRFRDTIVSNLFRQIVREDTFDGTSPKASIQHPLPTGGLFYLLASEGYRAGGFNSGGTGAPPIRLREFHPDHLRNYETGISLNPFNGRLSIRTAVFYDLWTDIQTDQYFTGSGLSYTDNAGDGRNVGIEAEISWRPTDRLTINLNGLVNRSKLTSVNLGFEAVATNGLPGVPDKSYSGTVTWRRPLTSDFELMLTGEGSYIGPARLTFDQRYSPTTSGYFSARLSAQLLTRDWRLAVAVDNPLNTSSDTFAYGNPFVFGQVKQVTPQRPRTVSLSLSAAF